MLFNSNGIEASRGTITCELYFVNAARLQFPEAIALKADYSITRLKPRCIRAILFYALFMVTQSDPLLGGFAGLLSAVSFVIGPIS